MTKPTVSESHDDEPVRVVVFPPESMDGEHWCPFDIYDTGNIGEAIHQWAYGADLGAEITLRVKMMTKRELERLPSI